MKKTKIVATLGPKTSSCEAIEKLINIGVNVFRLNFSHGDHKIHKESISCIRKAMEKLGKSVAILQDISGPKIRIGQIKGGLHLKRDDIIKLSKTKNDNDPYTLELSYPSIIDEVQVGEEVYFADGTIKTLVIDKKNDTLFLKLLNDGTLTSRKGVNFPNTKLNIDVITKKDEEDLIFGAKNDIDIVALSFVQNRQNILKAKEILKQHNAKPLIFSKIETKTAIDNLDEIIDESDGIMVARGDLGAELGVEKVPALQKIIIKKANEAGKPVITATQMLLSMTKSPYPTRAEVSDIANAIYDGTDAVMLSDETTIGEFPFKAVEVLTKTIIETEEFYEYYKDFPANKFEAIAKSASHLAKDLDVDAIVTFTTSGYSAKNIAKYRPKKIIYAVVHDEKIKRQLNIVWGVYPEFVIKVDKRSSKLIYDFINEANKKGLFVDYKNLQILITMGYVTGEEGTTNLIRILNNQSIEKIKSKYE